MSDMKVILFIITFSITSSLSFASPYIELNTSKIPIGTLINIPVNGLPVFILNRTDDSINYLNETHSGSINHGESCSECDSIFRSISPNIFVVWGFNPTTGCEVIYASSEDDEWVKSDKYSVGYFVDPCSDAIFDLSGRKISGKYSTTKELEIPEYSINSGVIRFNKSIYPTNISDKNF